MSFKKVWAKMPFKTWIWILLILSIAFFIIDIGFLAKNTTLPLVAKIQNMFSPHLDPIVNVIWIVPTAIITFVVFNALGSWLLKCCYVERRGHQPLCRKLKIFVLEFIGVILISLVYVFTWWLGFYIAAYLRNFYDSLFRSVAVGCVLEHCQITIASGSFSITLSLVISFVILSFAIATGLVKFQKE